MTDRPKAYLLVFDETTEDPSYVIRTRCYRISLPQIEKQMSYVSIVECIPLVTLAAARLLEEEMIEHARGRMAGQLLRMDQVEVEQDCVLIPRKRFNSLKQAHGYAARWKKLAKRFYRGLSFLGGRS